MNLLFFAAAVVALVLTGCQTTGYPGPAASDVDPVAILYSTNVLHEGDVVDIAFQYSTNYDTLQRIALDGTLNLNPVGPVRAAGRTVVELQQELAKAYSSLAKGDVITVNRVTTSMAIIYVSGAVLKPGSVELDHPLTVIEAVMAAGGFDTTRAKLSSVSVLRLEHGQQHAYHVNLKRVLAGKEETPFYLKPFDIIYIPAKMFNY
ncbi:MAG: SLBB domain-containing protein [Verrucomicrobiota bacterium]